MDISFFLKKEKRLESETEVTFESRLGTVERSSARSDRSDFMEKRRVSVA